MIQKIYLFLLMIFLQFTLLNAEEGFIRPDVGKCNLIENDSFFYWKYEESSSWIIVNSEIDDFYVDLRQIDNYLGNVQEVDCFLVWEKYWQYNAKNDGQNLSLDYDLIKKAAFSVDNVGTGFYISENGFFITNYHIANYFCDIPSNGSYDDKIECNDGYTLYSYPNRHEYNGNHDYALMRKKGVADSKFLSITAIPPKSGDRVFLAGYPLNVYNTDFEQQYFNKIKNSTRYPMVNSGRTGIASLFLWDPLVLSTGKINSVGFPLKGFFSNRGDDFECLGCSPAIIVIKSQWDNWDDYDTIIDNDLSHYTKSKRNYEISSGPGNSGSPLINIQNQVVGIMHRNNMFTSLISAVTQLDLCNISNSSNGERAVLAKTINSSEEKICDQLRIFCDEKKCLSNADRNAIGLEFLRWIMKKNNIPLSMKYY